MKHMLEQQKTQTQTNKQTKQCLSITTNSLEDPLHVKVQIVLLFLF